MSLHLERDLDALEQDLLAQSALVEEMIRMACRSLCSLSGGGDNVLTELLDREPDINRREVLIEEECLKILALHQPVAGDLRRVATVLKINGDLERIADLAVNIGERCEALSGASDLPMPDFLERMADATIGMVRDALDAFVQLDADAARRVRNQDDEIDSLNRRVIESVYQVIGDTPYQVEPALHLFSASRHLERIADHATNIAEDVIYLVEGEIARHRRDSVAAERHPLPRPNPGQ